jgi:hypothetical protein
MTVSAPDPDSAIYIAAVLALYVDLPDTPLRTSIQDQWQARRLQERGVPLPTVESAMLLASLRRRMRPTDVPPLPPIRSLAYFLPVIDELLAHPAPEGYSDYLRLKLQRMAQLVEMPAKVQKTTLSDDR